MQFLTKPSEMPLQQTGCVEEDGEPHLWFVTGRQLSFLQFCYPSPLTTLSAVSPCFGQRKHVYFNLV